MTVDGQIDSYAHTHKKAGCIHIKMVDRHRMRTGKNVYLVKKRGKNRERKAALAAVIVI